MTAYFSLQYKMISRKMRELGVNPVAGFVLVLAGFILISEMIYLRTGYGSYLIVLIAWSMLASVSERNRTEFLMSTFGDSKLRKIRMAENGLLSLPFIVSLICHHTFWESLVLLAGSMVLANVSFKTKVNFTIPTPFYQKPFEFATGFRKTVYIFPLIYALVLIALSVQNFNLGIFAMMANFLVSLTYYLKPEPEYFVWSYALSPSRFLWKKLVTASKYSIFSALPTAIVLGIFYLDKIGFILLFMLIGLAFLWVVILAKYSVYPNEINLAEIILICISVLFPPLLLFLIPYFYIRSVQTLNAILK